ncbi:peptide chain release factor 3, partial [Pseudoalteromonas citrea]
QYLLVLRDSPPVCRGTALGTSGVDQMPEGVPAWPPTPMPRQTAAREVKADEENFTGFVFKSQANMDQKHRALIAFKRMVTGK